MSYDNETLEAAAVLLERLSGNSIYEKAWRTGARRIRALKKLTAEDEKLTDSASQISQSSSQLGSPSGRLVPGG
jgi:hypothetical protein